MATDQEIRDAGFKYVPQQQYLLNPFELPEDQEPVVNQGIVNTNAFIGGGGGGGYYPGSPNELIGNYQSIVDARQKRLNNPSDTFLGFNTMRDRPATEASTTLAENIGIPQEMTMMGKVQDFFTPQSADQIISEGYEEPRFQPGIIGMLAGKIDNYRNLPQGDQAFIARNMGYTGPTVFGDNNSGLSKDVFGINTRSLKGNYGEFVGNKVTELQDALEKAKGKYTKNGFFDEDEYNKQTKLMQTKIDFYRNKVKERDADRKAAAEKISKDAQIAITNKTGGGGGGIDISGAGTIRNKDNDFKGDSGPTTQQESDYGYGSDAGFYAKGGRAGYFFGGRVNFKNGGLASIL